VSIADAHRIERAQGAAVLVAGLVKRFRSGQGQIAAVDDVSLAVDPGEALALMGPSGSGKSTLLHLIGGMDAPSAGSVLVGGIEVARLRGAEAARYRRTVGFVFQGFHLLGALSALDNVLASLIPRGLAEHYAPAARELLECVGLGDRFGALPGELSGGEQQRVAIARAMIAEPVLLLADEPTGSLDSATGMGVIELLLSLRRERGTTLILATHNQAVAERLDRSVRLRDGRVAA
jgi:putative ABC transport system ATP-binding protein